MDEIFTIDSIDTRTSPIMYIIKDKQGTIVQPKFYTEELQKVDPVQTPLPAAKRPRKPTRPPPRKAKQEAITTLFGGQQPTILRPRSQRIASRQNL